MTFPLIRSSALAPVEPVAKRNIVEKEAINNTKMITKSSGFVFIVFKKIIVFLKKFIKINYSKINEKIHEIKKKKPIGSSYFFVFCFGSSLESSLAFSMI